MTARPTSGSSTRAWASAFALDLRERARARFDTLSPRQRQYGLLTLLLGGGVALLWMVFSLSSRTQDARSVEATALGTTSVTNVGILPPGAQLNPVDQWVGTAGRKLAQYESEREEQGRLNKDRQSFETRTMQRFAELEQRLTSAQQGAAAAQMTTSASLPIPHQPVSPVPTVPTVPTVPPMPPMPPEHPVLPAQAPQFPPAPFPSNASAGIAFPPAPSGGDLSNRPRLPPGTPADLPRDGRSDMPSFPTPFAPPVISRVSLGASSSRSISRDDAAYPGAAPSLSGATNTTTDAATTTASAPSSETRTVATFLPVSFTRGTLLGGLDAPTGGQSQSNPQPVLIRLSDNSVLPNQFRGEYRDCFVVAAGYGDISSERAYLRTENLTCVRDDGATLEVRIQGTVYGEDGKVGMRGRLVTKQGQMLANALLAGVVSGIGQGLSTANTSYSSSPLGTIASTDSSTDAYRAGIGSGVGKALDRLAQYYIKLAENTFPVIEVDAGREIDVVITKGARIDVPMSGIPGDAPASDVDGQRSIKGLQGAIPPTRRFPTPDTRYLEAPGDENF